MKNHVLNKLPVFVLAAVMAIGGPSLSAFAETDSGSSVDTLLDEFQGTYTALFPAFRDDRNDAMWEKSLSEYAGVNAGNAETVKDSFLSVYESDIHGEEAQKKAEEEPGWFMFDCSFAGGVDSMTFDGNTISGLDKDGNEIFNNTYEYFDSLKKDFDPMTEIYMAGVSEEDWPLFHIFVSDGPDDEFKYFAFADDTPADTYHLEFRYGSDPEDLCRYFTGPYAYWLTAGFDVSADEDTLKSTVELFCLENMDYSTHTEEAISQISDLVGSWIADLSEFGEAYADTELTVTIDENGHGITMMNDEQTADFEAYAYDNGEKGDGKGIYIAYSNLENEAEAAGYTVETDENRETVLTFYAKDGVISYKKVS